MNAKILTQVGLFAMTVLAGVYAVTHPGSMMVMLLVGALVAAALMLMPRLMYGLLPLSGAAALVVPVFGGASRPSAQEAFFLIAAAYGLLSFAMSWRSRQMDLSDRGIMIFGLVIIMLMCVRGVGFRLLGSSGFGGRVYIVILAAMASYLLVPDIRFTPKQLRMLVWASVSAAFLTVVTQLMVIWRPGLYGVFGRFVDLHAEYYMSIEVGGQMAAQEQFRLHGTTQLAGWLWAVTVALGWRSRRRVLFLVAMAGTVALCLLSGFRGATVSLAVSSVAAMVVTSRSRGRAFAILAVAGLFGYLLLFLIGPHLAWPMQRALSFVPGVAWDARAVDHALDSYRFRLDMWRVAGPHIPDYLLIGRGLLLEDVYRHAYLHWGYYITPEFLYATHSYHSGPLSLLLDTGIPGLIGFLLFQIGIVRNAARGLREASRDADPFLRGFLLASSISVGYRLFSYYLFFGDIATTLPQLVIQGMAIRWFAATIRSPAADGSRAAPAVAAVRDSSPAPVTGKAAPATPGRPLPPVRSDGMRWAAAPSRPAEAAPFRRAQRA